VGEHKMNSTCAIVKFGSEHGGMGSPVNASRWARADCLVDVRIPADADPPFRPRRSPRLTPLGDQTGIICASQSAQWQPAIATTRLTRHN
jgi:hypothetical protein